MLKDNKDFDKYNLKGAHIDACPYVAETRGETLEGWARSRSSNQTPNEVPTVGTANNLSERETNR